MNSSDVLTLLLAESELRRRVRERAAPKWRDIGRPNQIAPDGDWQTWVILAGRGFGKTRAGAEWVFEKHLTCPRIAIIAPTFADARDTCIEGESGLYTLHSQHIQTWNRSIGELVFNNGSQVKLFSGEKPARLRGPQHYAAWFDELPQCAYPQETLDMLLLGLRLGTSPQLCVTTTPLPIKTLKSLIANPSTAVTRGSTYENKANLAPQFFDKIITRYENTRLGRQEISGEMLEDVEGALWERAWIDEHRRPLADFKDMERVVVAIDPAGKADRTSDQTGICVAGVLRGEYYVFEIWGDRAMPDVWAAKALEFYARYQADSLIAEQNNGGEMVRAVLQNVCQRQKLFAPVKLVHASRGKETRAEPISVLYRQGQVHHVGTFVEGEEQLTSFPVANTGDDQVDAVVWALTDLASGPSGKQGAVAPHAAPIDNYLKARW